MSVYELTGIVSDLKDLRTGFTKPTGDGEFGLTTGDKARYMRLVLEAKGIIDAGLGALNDFALPLHRIASPPTFGMLDRPSPTDLENAIALADGGLNQMRRKGNRAPHLPSAAQKPPYVSTQRISELQTSKAGLWDLQRLVRMLEELNLAHEHDAHFTTAMLVRAVTDHVPPIFGAKSFTEVANNHSGGKSFREQIKHLDTSLRKVADGLLHQQIRKVESLPHAQQVNFSAALDVLLEEVVRQLALN